MTAIYQAALWCDECADGIKWQVAVDCVNRHFRGDDSGLVGMLDWSEFPKPCNAEDVDDITAQLDNMSEHDYDSDDYPKGCCGSDESDGPEHCDGCGVFLENELTADGADYVVRTVRENRLEGRNDTVACTVWAEFYSYLDLPHWGVCDDCSVEAMLNDYDVCEDGCDWSGASGEEYDLSCTD